MKYLYYKYLYQLSLVYLNVKCKYQILCSSTLRPLNLTFFLKVKFADLSETCVWWYTLKKAFFFSGTIYIYKKKRYKHKWRNEISPVWPASVPTRSRVPWMWSVWPESNSPERLKTCRHTRGKTFNYNNARHSCAGHTNTTECRKKKSLRVKLHSLTVTTRGGHVSL